MCGRYTVRRPLADVADAFAATYHAPHAPDPLLIRPRYNVAPSQSVPAVKLAGDDRELLGLQWGFRPFWSKGGAPAPINARAETVASSGMFRQAFASRRCLLPCDGFYEWKRSGKAKIPHFFHLADDSLFALAGIYEGDTCCHITTTPNEILAPIHDRMPVMLLPEHYAAWLDPKTPADKLHALLKPLPAELMDEYEVSTRVNSPKNEGAGLTQRL